MKALIGLIGEKGAGKESLGDALMKEYRFCGYTVSRHHFSDILNETLRNWSIETTRANLQKLAQVMDAGFGEGALTRAIRQRLEKDPADIVIADGMRWKTDEQMIRSFPYYMMIYVTADPKVRFERLKARKEKAGEGIMTYEQFLKEERAPNEIDIPIIGARADFKIENNGTLLELREEKVLWLIQQPPPRGNPVQ